MVRRPEVECEWALGAASEQYLIRDDYDSGGVLMLTLIAVDEVGGSDHRIADFLWGQCLFRCLGSELIMRRNW